MAPEFKHADKRGRRSSVRPDIHLSELARAVGVGPDYLSKLFRGMGSPSIELAQKLAEKMGIPLETLLAELADEKAKRRKIKEKTRDANRIKPKKKTAGR
jgi:transcriptional regulator with XRE-family HTH domain